MKQLMKKQAMQLVLFAVMLLAGPLLSGPLLALDVDVCLSPTGGFAPSNNERRVMVDGASQPFGLNNVLLGMIHKTPASGAIKIVMYNFAHRVTFGALLDKALKDGVQVKVILDNCADWTKDMVKDFVTTVDKVARRAAEEKKPFDFQVKLVTPEVMHRHKRTRVLDDGKLIMGTMHQKFGIFYDDRTKPATLSFSGSANISPSSDDLYSENRIFYRNSLAVNQTWEAQFARLWNEYSDPGTNNCATEPAVALTEKPEFEILFNIEKNQVGSFTRIDERVIGLLDEVEPEGSCDIAMFSFTHIGIANKILSVAEKKPGAKFRLFFDHSMLLSGPDRRGLMPPMIEEKVKEKKLTNVEIRYKFRANSYAYDAKKTKEVVQDHFRAPLLHHKFMIVNKKKIITGSYNWSSSAELRNIEDDVVFDAATPFGKEVIDRYLAEFDFLWNSRYEDRHAGKDVKPYSITRDYALEYEKKIKETLKEFLPSKIQKILDDGPLPLANIRNLARVGGGELKQAMDKLKAVFLVETFTREDGVERYRLAD